MASSVNPALPSPAASSDVKSAVRVLQIFQLFAETRQPAPLSLIAHRLGVPKSSCLALLRTLEANGYLYQLNDFRDYYPTRRIWKEAQVIAQGDPFLSRLRPLLQGLSERTRETAFLARRSGSEVHYVEVIESGQALRFAATVGEKRPLYIGAAGLCLLGAMPQPEREALVKGLAFEKFSDRTVAGAKALLKVVDEGLARGWFLSIGAYQSGVSSIGRPIRLNGEDYAVVVAAPTDRLREHEQAIVSAVHETWAAMQRQA